ncbi:hypothetical protein [Streptomyces sp. NPDC048845]|uniref:hypothetical protein n=1 Tax=Streptomyces sp. NPDC048845 TaxID=3155390 RepID=UPI0034364F65
MPTAPGGALILADRPDGTVVRVGPVVAKAHPTGGDPGELAARLGIAAHYLLRGILLPPLSARGLGGGRIATCWAYGIPVAPDDPGAAPWETGPRRSWSGWRRTGRGGP